MKFTELNLVPGLQEGIDEAGFADCTQVQERTFLETFKARDVLVQSQTGTGKTAAFLITIFQLFSTQPERWRKALVVVPTRELAVQVEEEAHLLGGHLNFSIGSIFGGVGYGPQEKLLEDGVDVLIGTPGRLLDLAGSRRLRFGDFDTLVIDEADRMFDMGFFPDMRRIIREMPERTKRMTMLFSATLSTRVRNLAWEYMNGPAEIEVVSEQVTVNEITQELYHVPTADKVSLLLGLLKKEKPRNALIFANMKYTVVELAKRLNMNGYPTRFIMGDLPQRKRLALINGIKTGEITYLVATDVAARGLHIEGLDLVVNFDIPEDFEIYVHRIGRTARAGKTGKAITFACEQYVYGLPAIENFIGMKIPVLWAGDDLYVPDQSAGIDLRREIRIDDERERDHGGRRTREPRAAGPRERRPRAAGGRERSIPPKDRVAPASAAREPGAARNESRRDGGYRDRVAPPRAPRPQAAKPDMSSKPAPNAPLEDRLRYYREKYGEDFNPGNGKGNGDAGGNHTRARTNAPGKDKPAVNQRKSPSPSGRGPSKRPQEKSAGSRAPLSQGPKAPRFAATSGSKEIRAVPQKAQPEPPAKGGSLLSRIKGLFKKK